MIMVTEPEKKEQKEKGPEAQPDYLPMSAARELASAILFNLSQARDAYLHATGRADTRRLVVHEHEIDAEEHGSPDQEFGRFEREIIHHAAELQAKVLDCVADPDHHSLEKARQEILKARHIYGERFDVAVGHERQAVQREGKTMPLLADRDWKPKPEPVRSRGVVVLHLYELPERERGDARLRPEYHDTGLSYTLPEDVLTGIPRPAQIAIVIKDQRPLVDLEHTLRLNETKKEIALRGIETALKGIQANRATQFTLQEIVRQHLLKPYEERRCKEDAPEPRPRWLN